MTGNYRIADRLFEKFLSFGEIYRKSPNDALKMQQNLSFLSSNFLNSYFEFLILRIAPFFLLAFLISCNDNRIEKKFEKYIEPTEVTESEISILMPCAEVFDPGRYQHVRVLLIDGLYAEAVKYKFCRSIRVRPGEHSLQTNIWVTVRSPLSDYSIDANLGVSFDAFFETGQSYRVRGNLFEQERRAQIWIENSVTGEVVGIGNAGFEIAE